MVTPYPTNQIEKEIRLFWPDFCVNWVEETTSTNTDLLNKLRKDICTPELLIASRQTAGRARMSKTWQTSVEQALTFSLMVPVMPHHLHHLALVAGCALIHALEENYPLLKLEHLIKIKWPNDLWFKDKKMNGWRKLAGILIETCSIQSQRYAVIGIGLNILPPPENLHPTGIPAGSLTQLISSDPCDLVTVFKLIMPKIVLNIYNYIQSTSENGFHIWHDFFKSHDALFAQALYTSNGIHGIGAGVDTQGCLLIQTDDNQLQQIHSGEVSVRLC